MPFTVSHVAAILPLRRKELPFAALAAGSMAPDLPYFVPVLSDLVSRGMSTHSAAGVVTVDLGMGIVTWAVWRALAPALHDLAPRVVRTRWQPWTRPTARAHQVMLAVALGAATHVGWDEFTHEGRFGTRHVAALAETHTVMPADLPGYRYAQYLSGVAGLARGSELLDAPSRRALAFLAITSTMGGAAAAVMLLCAVWWVRTRQAALRSVAGSSFRSRSRR